MEWISLIASGLTYIVGRFFGGKKAKKYLAVAQQASNLVETLIKAIEDDKISTEELKILKEALSNLKKTISDK